MPIVSTPGQNQQYTDTPVSTNAPVSTPPVADPVVNNTNDPINTVTSNPQEDISSPSSRMQTMVSSPATVTPLNDDDDDFFSDDDDLFGDGSSSAVSASKDSKKLSLSRMSEEVRKSTIDKVFDSVLGRAPADRDYSYYRFSTLTEDSLVKSLLGLPEHKQMIEKAKEHTKLKQDSQSLDLRVSEADQRILSMQEEVITLRQILEEKNQYIRELRGIPQGEVQQVEAPTTQSEFVPQETVQDRYSPLPYDNKNQGDMNSRQVITLPTPWDEVKSLFATIFNRRK